MPKISKGHRYVTILDAGSSGTRIYVYRYATDDDGKTIIPLELTLVYDHKIKYADGDTRMLYPFYSSIIILKSLSRS